MAGPCQPPNSRLIIGDWLKGAQKMNFANVDWSGILINWFPMLLIFGVWVFFLRQMQGGRGIYSNQRRIADALERIATALEQRR